MILSEIGLEIGQWGILCFLMFRVGVSDGRWRILKRSLEEKDA